MINMDGLIFDTSRDLSIQITCLIDNDKSYANRTRHDSLTTVAPIRTTTFHHQQYPPSSSDNNNKNKNENNNA